MSLDVHLKVSKHGQDQSSCPHIFGRPWVQSMPEIFGQKHPGYEKFSLRNFNFLTEKIDFEK